MSRRTPSSQPLPNDDLAAVERLKDAFAKLKAELGKVIVGQQAVLEELLDRDLRARPLPADRRARPGQDADDPHPGRRAEPDLQPDPVHPRPDALGHHRDRGDPGGQGDRRPPVQVPPRADLRQHRAGRRDQPHPAQDPGRAAGGHAGAAGHRRRRAAPPARPVLRPGHPEPDRAGRDVPPARGPARPVHAQHPGRLPRRGRGARHRPADDLDPQAERRPRSSPGPTSWSSRRSSGRCRSPTTSRGTRSG